MRAASLTSHHITALTACRAVTDMAHGTWQNAKTHPMHPLPRGWPAWHLMARLLPRDKFWGRGAEGQKRIVMALPANVYSSQPSQLAGQPACSWCHGCGKALGSSKIAAKRHTKNEDGQGHRHLTPPQSRYPKCSSPDGAAVRRRRCCCYCVPPLGAPVLEVLGPRDDLDVVNLIANLRDEAVMGVLL